MIAIRPTGVVLKTEDTSSAFGFGGSVAQDARGRFYTAWRERISIWSPSGQLVRTFGRTGSGPGEFGTGLKHLFINESQQLVVRDGTRLTWMSPDGNVLRTLNAAALPFSVGSFSLLPRNRFLGAGVGVTPGSESLHIIATDPKVSASSFGPLAPEDKGHPDGGQRVVAYAGGEQFWAGPPAYSRSRGYELELWSTSGSLIRTIVREAPWFPAAAPGKPVSRKERPPAGIVNLHVDARGLLFSFAAVPNGNWTPTATPDKFVDIYFDVIDVERGMLVAAMGPLSYSEAIAKLPFAFLPHADIGYQVTESSDEYPMLRFLRVDLVPNSGNARR